MKEMKMDTPRAQPIYKKNRGQYYWSTFQEWVKDSLMFYPILFMLGAILLVWITREIDIRLITNDDLSDWWVARSAIVVTISSSISSSVLSLLAIGFSISLVAIQMANQQYSPRVTSIVLRSTPIKIALSIIIAACVYSFLLMIEVLRSPREEVTIVSLITSIVMIFACLLAFLYFIKSVLLLIKLTNIISFIDKSTQMSIDDNYPHEEGYTECQAVPLDQPIQVISYACLSGNYFDKRVENGVLRGLEFGDLVDLANHYRSVIRVLPQFGDFVNQGDPVVEVYGESKIPTKLVLEAIYVEPERGIYQDPGYGIRMLVDIALQALSPAVNAPTTAHQVILRLTNLLSKIAERPPHPGAFADEEGQMRLLNNQINWDQFVDLTYNEIIHYGWEDPQTRKSLTASFDYLLVRVPESLRPPLEQQKTLLLSSKVS
jgi:uncharacterized membrane protein